MQGIGKKIREALKLKKRAFGEFKKRTCYEFTHCVHYCILNSYHDFGITERKKCPINHSTSKRKEQCTNVPV